VLTSKLLTCRTETRSCLPYNTFRSNNELLTCAHPGKGHFYRSFIPHLQTHAGCLAKVLSSESEASPQVEVEALSRESQQLPLNKKSIL
jgi:hypothetical protein